MSSVSKDEKSSVVQESSSAPMACKGDAHISEANKMRRTADECIFCALNLESCNVRRLEKNYQPRIPLHSHSVFARCCAVPCDLETSMGRRDAMAVLKLLR